MSMNMKRIVCYCLAISMIPIKVCYEIDEECMEPQLLVKETYCGNNNVTTLTMHTHNSKSLEYYLFDGCPVDFNEPLYLNNTFYLECDTENSCFDEAKEISRETYYLECEEVDIFRKEIITSKEHNENTTQLYSLRNKTTTEIYDETVEYIFTNGTTTDLDGQLKISSTIADVSTTESSTVVGSISFNDDAISSKDNEYTTYDVVLTNDITNPLDTNVIATKSTPAVDITDLSDVYMFTTKSTTMTDEESEENHNSSKNYIFHNETTTEHYDVFKDTDVNSTNIDKLRNKTDINSLKAAEENPSDSNNILVVLGYSLAGVATTAALAFGAYRLRRMKQSGSYLMPDTGSPPGFIELA
ncbi:uncharacterized protein LOC125224852 [Leguminivora glycinivorella]|uniref:uncharacterized protein LOC125224852 n=1 Tax=Leguminivora glycinivorella TaxID=1035111 RepID=UPI00200E26B6|nr:uncharacterized protein LOC125224852 [Leguminivora glycinivorella]